ncbi:MAG: sugar-binding protein, partial [Chloroflexota bacterium]
YDIPAWIGEPDVTSIGLLGLAAYEQARPNRTTEDILTKIAEGLAQYHLGDDSTYPWGMHPVQANAPGFYHTWGAHMTHALVVAGMVMHRQDWIDSAAADANSFMLRQLVFERFRQIGPIPDRLGQIAYGTNMIVQTYAALYHATGDEKYARYAGLAASWYFGNNMADTQMYYPDSGLVFDGINGPVSWRVNRNSGAESTIEGLMSMIAIANLNDARATDLLQAKSVGGNDYQILQAEDGERVIGTPIYYTGDWTGEGYISGGRYVGIGEGQRMRLSFDIAQEDDYLLYVDHMHQAAGGSANTIQRADMSPDIDGSDSDWSPDIPTLDSNTAQQFLRGAGLWKGADVDSHSIRLQWDESNLYVLADTRDPALDQTNTLSSVGQGDALWLYFTSSLDASTISAKMTLAQTPDGAQIWDWKNVGFVNGSKLSFKAHDDSTGYSFEAALPWSALGFKTPPQAGAQLGFEAGRGIGGNTFMDLTGRDPDVPANLLKLMLVAPGMAASASTAPKVALEVTFANEKAVTIPESISPDSDFFWLDKVTDQPVHLTPGAYTLRYRYAGETSSNPGKSKVDAFYLQPAVARRLLQLPNGKVITFAYNTLTGETTWEEQSS